MTDLPLFSESSCWYCPQRSSHHSSNDFIGSSVICVRLSLNTAALRVNQGPERHFPTNRASYMTEPNVLCLQHMSKRSSVCIDPRGGEGKKGPENKESVQSCICKQDKHNQLLKSHIWLWSIRAPEPDWGAPAGSIVSPELERVAEEKQSGWYVKCCCLTHARIQKNAQLTVKMPWPKHNDHVHNTGDMSCVTQCP